MKLAADGMAFYRQRRFAEAEACYRALASVLMEQGRVTEAEGAYRAIHARRLRGEPAASFAVERLAP